MKKLLFIAVLLAFTHASYSQLGGLIKKMKDKSQQRIDNKVDKEIDKGLDQVEGKKAPAEKDIASPEESVSTPVGENKISGYSRYDFIPGDSILYAEDFQQEQLGELPVNWNTSGSGEVTTLDSSPGQWLRLHKQFVYLTANQKKFKENYTIEFDLILQLKNNGWMFPDFNVGFFASDTISNTDNQFLKQYDKNAAVLATLHPGGNNDTKVALASWIEKKPFYTSDTKAYERLEQSYFKPVHIAIQVQKERYRMWINQDKVFDAPKAVPAGQTMNQLVFGVTHTNYPEDKYGVFIGNIKVATGKPDTRHKLIEEGKFSTTGILFDFQSAVIRPESYAVIKEIAGVVKENPSIKVKVTGHTSSDGDDKANMELSKKRAAAVKDLLVNEFGIDAARLGTEGKGETQPIADNKTKEGKSANRRVEFTRL